MPTFLSLTVSQGQSTASLKYRTNISQAACKQRNAIFGPTPGNEHSSSTVFGTSESKSSRRRCAACLMYLVNFFFSKDSVSAS
jgi:hypothetical protein